ncbi:MAG: dynamin family protein [Veillonellales bacterium]
MEQDIKDKEHPTNEEQVGIADGTDSAFEIQPDLEKLRIYTQTKLALASQLRSLREALISLGLEESEQQCGELTVKLAEDRFTLAVLGQFKRGKSSLMNAIIGRELLPTGVLPLTSAITVLKYGPEERLLVRREDSIFPDELPVASLADYVTEKGNPSNRKKVKTACVELPLPFLRREIEFVDTPGVGSAVTANTVTTYGFLPECDAVLFVTSVDTPMTSLELEFLKEIQEYVDKIFFVVNKIDLVKTEEREEVLKFVKETIRKQTGCSAVRVFPVSSRNGIAAKNSGDPALYEQSGIKSIEEALASFLSEEKASVFLAAVARKALQLLDYETDRGSFTEAALQLRAETVKNEKIIVVRRNPHDAAVMAAEVRTKLQALYQGILNNQIAEVVKNENLTAAVPAACHQDELSGIVSPPAVSDLQTDLQIRGCPVCRHIAQLVSQFFAHWQYKLGSDGQSQAEFAAELGFCPLHTWQLLAMSSPHGASVGYVRLAEEIARRLRENITADKGGEAVQRLVRNSQNCRVCGMIRQAEKEYIRRLAVMVGEPAENRIAVPKAFVFIILLCCWMFQPPRPVNFCFLIPLSDLRKMRKTCRVMP